MFFLIRVLWLSLFALFRFIGHHIFRLQKKLIAQNSSMRQGQKGEEEEEEESESLLRFRFPTFEEFAKKNDVHFIGDQGLCVNPDDNCPLVVTTRETPNSENSENVVGLEHVENIAEPEISSDVSMIDKLGKEMAESRKNAVLEHVENIVEQEMAESRKNVVGLEHVGNMVEPQISSDVSMIDKLGKEMAESRKNAVLEHVENIVEQEMAESRKNVVGLEHVGNMVEPQISSDVSMIDKLGKEEMADSRKTSEYKVEMIENFVQEIGDSKEIEIETENVGEQSQMVDNLVNNVNSVRHDAHFLSDDESLVSDSDSDDSMVSSNSSFRSSFIDSLSDGLLSDIDFQKAFEIDTLMEYGSRNFLTEDMKFQNFSKVYGSDDLDDEDEDILQELKDMERDLHDGLNDEDEDILEELKGMEYDLEGGSESPSEQSAENQSPSSKEENLESNLADVTNTSVIGGRNTENELLGEHQNIESSNLVVDESERKQNSETSSSGEQLSSDSDEQNGLEREWEHQDLVEQLKMEIKKVQAIGLPTILEESESPKIMDDLKPWKIEHKYQHDGTMDELNIFYKSYREKMRKLDILNFQKMYTIGFLRLKDPLQSFTKGKISIPTLSAIVSFDCWPCKPKPSSEIHPPLMKMFSKELESELEMVYVGQMCLSWEFLCWEYGKALELWESDPHGILHYNEVAEKFQIFQVLLTRFLEEELFEGPRVQHYVKSRCVFRDLLQVPVVRDDNYRNRKKEKKVISKKEAVTSLQLVEIIEESIRILWQFIRTDKDTSNAVLVKYRRSSSVKLQSPADANLFAEVRSTLLKKDKKMKELTRSENCVLRSIRRHQEEDSDNVLHFFSRVDLKLVSRVLNMPRLSTEQLVWCSDKLHRINFIGRKLHIEVEPSILLFPCS